MCRVDTDQETGQVEYSPGTSDQVMDKHAEGPCQSKRFCGQRNLPVVVADGQTSPKRCCSLSTRHLL